MNTPQYQGPGPYNTPQHAVPAPPVPLPHKPSRGKAWLTHGAVAFVALLIGTGIGSSGDADADNKAGASAKPGPTVTATKTTEAGPAPTVTKTVTAKPKAPKKTQEPGPVTSFSGDGEYLVGEDIKAGTYKTAGVDGSFGCYWERAKDASGEFESIIANNNLKGPGRVTLNKGEYFKTNRCQEWKKVG
ncbi:hypothetical protein [Streptomyces sp. NPDC005181]|uniref:hypothetical protein n=1 Tax=Streptomyces sp. NPDC005181 TaxID=3156869 RepID=UPI0033B680F1